MKNLFSSSYSSCGIKRFPLLIGLFIAPFQPLVSNAYAVESNTNYAIQVTQQTRTIKGQIIDENGEPLIGVSVLVKGTTVGTVTDLDGNYSLDIPSGHSALEISYIGYKTINVSITQSPTLNVKMEPDTQSLDEVVVVGYGTMKKRDLTGSVTSVKSDDIMKAPVSNAMEALQGQVPGMDIVRNSGKATSGVTINIRGKRSLSDVTDEWGNDVANAPLFIIDGMQGGNFADIAPSDIESIEILKDASSTAIYGSQGANGVVIITTKKGAQGKVKISYNGYYGINGWAQYPEMLSGNDYIQVRREAYRTAGQWESPADDQKLFSAEEWQAIQNGEWTNWKDEVLHNGMVTSHQVSASGGTEKTTALLSAGYYHEKGSFVDDKMNKYNLRLNVEHKFNKFIKIGANSQVTHYAQDERAENVLWRAATNVPLGKAYDENGKVVLWPLGTSSRVNPLADEASDNTAKHHILHTNIIANGYLELTPIEGLSIRSNLGTNYTHYRKQDFEGANSIDRAGEYATSKARVSSSEKSFVNWDNIINYTRTINNHTFGVTALTSWTQSKYTNVLAQGEGQLVDSNLWHDLGANDKNSYVIGSNYIQHQTSSYAIRANYSYKSRYMFTVSNRWDGDSRLAEGNKWAAFPSVAAAWRINEETFLSDVKAISNLKLRLSWGKTGNSGIMAYGTQSGVTSKTNSAFQDNGYIYYLFNEYIGNKDTSWEISKTWDLGLDIGLIDNRISATIDLYKVNTSDILLPRQLPSSMGASNNTTFKTYQNIGATQNKGIEIGINTVNIEKSKFRWTSTLSFSANREKIVDLIDGKDMAIGTDVETQTLMIGRPLFSFYEYTNLGVWQESEREEAAKYFKDAAKTQPFLPGDIKLKDLNGDNIINSDDRGYIGSRSPKWTGGFNNTFKFWDFDLNVYFVARWGQYIDYELSGAYDPQGKSNFPTYFNYWTPENASNDFPRPANTQFFNYIGYQSLRYIDGSYWKLKTLSLGYTLPKIATNKLGISNLRVYVTANNVFSKAKNHLIQDYDAERGGSAKAPLQRQLVFGINLDI